MSYYKLKPYKNRKRPCIFFGFSKHTFQKIRKHRGLAILILGGSDIITLRKKIKFLRKRKNIRYVAISNWLAKDLRKLKVKKRYRILFHLLNSNNFYPKELGKNIYIYSNGTNKYGKNIYRQIIKKMPKYKFIIASHKKFKPNQLTNIYHQCFIGLRLTKHDGNANTTQELGLCGIRCIHNGDSPNAIHWKSANDIIKSIRNESKLIGQKNEELSEKVKKYYDVENKNPKWLYTNFYK